MIPSSSSSKFDLKRGHLFYTKDNLRIFSQTSLLYLICYASVILIVGLYL